MGAETLVEEDARALEPEPLQGETEDPVPVHEEAQLLLKKGFHARLAASTGRQGALSIGRWHTRRNTEDEEGIDSG